MNPPQVGPVLEAICQRKLVAERVVCAIAGESGIGKSTLASSLQARLSEEGIGAALLGQDDYFRLPPRANDARRRLDIGWVGLGEVDLAKLQVHLDAFLAGVTEIQRPRLDRVADHFDSVPLDLTGVAVLLVEGTYVLGLRGDHLRVFLDGDFRETEAARRSRARDPIDAFSDEVLAIEHRLVRSQKALADLVITPTWHRKGA